MAKPFLVGTAKTTINPPIGSFIAGDAQDRRFDAQHDDLYFKAVAISAKGENLVLATIDCIGLAYPDVQEIRQRASEASGGKVAPERIIICSTHIHNGPDVVGLWGPDYTESGRDPEYMETLISRGADTVAKAVQSQTPASAHWAGTDNGETWVRNECEPEKLDRSVVIIQFRDEAEQSLATLTNFACHPTILDGVHNFVSADWVGAYYAEMEAAYPGEHLFFQGAIGGWIQPDKGDRSYAWAQECAKRLAGAVFPALAHARPLEGDTIQHEMKRVHFPVENEGWRALSEAGLFTREIADTVETEVAWFSIGSAQAATHPGETIPEHGFATKAMMSSGPKLLLGLGMDGLGYIMPPAWFENPEKIPDAEYLIATSLGPQTERIMMDALREIIPAT